MKESYKVEHKEKYHISVEKVWSNLKKWWFLILIFMIFALGSMLYYAKKDYSEQKLAYEAQEQPNSDNSEEATTPGVVPATQVELENAYLDLTQMVIIMQQLEPYTNSTLVEENVQLQEAWLEQLNNYDAQNVTESKEQLYATLMQIKNTLRKQLCGLNELPAKIIDFRLSFSGEERKLNNFSSIYGIERGDLKAILKSQEIKTRLIGDELNSVVLYDDDKNLNNGQSIDGERWSLTYLLIGNKQKDISITGTQIKKYIDDELKSKNDLASVVIVQENDGKLGDIMPEQIKDLQNQMNNLAFRTVMDQTESAGSIIISQPTFRLISRGSVIYFGLFVCMAIAVFFIIILLDHKVRTEDEFYDLFGESPLAVLTGKNINELDRCIQDVVYYAKKKSFDSVGILYLGDAQKVKRVADSLSKGISNVDIKSLCTTASNISKLYECNEILVVYDTESITEKQLNQVITEVNQVEGNLTGMILC